MCTYLLTINNLYWVAKWFNSIYKVSFLFEIDVSSQRIANQLISANWSKSRLLGRLRIFRAFEQIHMVPKCCNTRHQLLFLEILNFWILLTKTGFSRCLDLAIFCSDCTFCLLKQHQYCPSYWFAESLLPLMIKLELS